MIFAPDAHNNLACPIWDGLKIVSIHFPAVEKNIHDGGSRYYSSRAGGPFLLMKDGAALLDWESPINEQKSLTNRQKVNLSHWIYQHNLDSRLLDELSSQDLQERGWFKHWMDDHRDRVLKLDKDWVEGHRDCEPSAEDRMLTFLRELIRGDAAGEPCPDEDLLKAAGGCRNCKDLLELQRHVVEQGWTGSRDPQCSDTSPYRINFSARLYVDGQLRDRGRDQQPTT